MSRRIHAVASGVVVAVLATLSPATQATPLDATQTLQQFNLLVIGNAASNSHVDGRSFIGGMLTGNASFEQNPGATPASSYTGLTVLGNASGSINVNGLGATILGNLSNANINSGPSAVLGNANSVNFNGASYIGGTKTNTNQNGGLLAPATAAAAFSNATSTNFDALLTATSTQLSGLTGNSTVSFAVANTATFNAAPVNGLAIFDLTGIDTTVFGKAQLQFNLNGATTVVINSDETSASISANFLGGSASAIGAKTIWNFYNATTLNLNNQFGGSVLAINAHLTNGNNIEGGVFVDSLTQNGEIHLQSFTGTIPAVPEPTTSALMLAGLGLVGAIARRRKTATV